MDGDGFMRLIDAAFAPLLGDLGFRAHSPRLSGREYCVRFESPTHEVSVSFEPGDNALFVYVFRRLRGGGLSDIDDPSQTPLLSHLNERFAGSVTWEERVETDKALAGIVGHDKEELALITAARHLRLVLPRYLHSERLPPSTHSTPSPRTDGL